MTQIKLELFERGSIIAPLIEAIDSNGKPIHRAVAMIRPTSDYSLSQIPKGPNPRDIDNTTKLFKDIKDSFMNDACFTVLNGGICVVVDQGSISVDGEYITFTCKDSDKTGHYDGQHTIAAIEEALAEKENGGNAVFLFLITENAYSSVLRVREAATAWNNRSAQKKTSERNIRGGFDFLKSYINQQYKNNIMWRQNQKSTQDEKIRAECSSLQLINILSTFLPGAYIPGDNGSLQNIAGFARVGETLFDRVMDDSTLGPVLEATYVHADMIIALSDLIQKSARHLYGEDSDNCAIIKAVAKTQLNKEVINRKFLKQTIFESGKTIEGALNKDLIPPIIYGFVNTCFDYDETTNTFSTIYRLDDLAAIWYEAGPRILRILDRRFKNDFQKIYKSRFADFVNDTSIWSRIEKEVENTIKAATYDDSRKDYILYEKGGTGEPDKVSIRDSVCAYA
jgi:hypothetical protein